MDKLNEGNSSKKWKEVKTYAHKIKGSLGYMGVTSIQSEIIYLEQLELTNIDENEIKNKVAVIEKEIMLILIELKDIKF